jgi:signal transduction histidine kinase
MINDLRNKKLGKLWIKLTGDTAGYAMENRAFNYISLVSFILLFNFLVGDLYVKQYIMAGVLVLLMITVGVLYYFSRVHKYYQTPLILYGICCYLALILNYYINEGINGPTVCLFFLIFHLLIAIGRPRHYAIWIVLQILIVPVLLVSEYLHPEWVPKNYPSVEMRFVDIGFSYIVAITFIFSVINFLRLNYNRERKLAIEREKAISRQNILIKEQYQLLAKVNAEKDTLFSIISHDLRSPLDSIMGYLSLVSANQLEESEKNELEAELLQRTRYTSDMLHNLLSWAKAQMSGVTVNLSPVNLSDLVAEVTRNKFLVADKKGVAIECTVDRDLHVMADKDMLTIVIRNLINNAIKFTPQGGSVSINARPVAINIELEVKDNGIGIPDEKHPEIFAQTTSSTYGTDNEKGIGLGLRLCKGFVNYQNGSIYFSTKLGEGTTFFVALPSASDHNPSI